MSEYQYYEFQAVDRPLDAAEQAELRALSSRARITATGFVNHYEWGDLKADPRRLMERYFDLFLYLANWGSRRLSIRLPARLIDVGALQRFCPDDGVADVRTVGPHAIIDIWRDEIDQDDWDDGGGWLAALAALRGDIMRGDLRVFYLVWLMAVEDGHLGDEAVEPLAGIAPLSAPLRAFADFFYIDSDLVDAAAAEGAPPPREAEHAGAETFIRSLPEADKVALLLRLHDGDSHLGAELRQRRLAAAGRRPDTGGARRSAGKLRETARRMAAERHRLAAEKAAAERRRREAEQAWARNRHLARLAERGEAPWREAEELISRRNQPGYERAMTLIIDLGEVARSQGEEEPSRAASPTPTAISAACAGSRPARRTRPNVSHPAAARQRSSDSTRGSCCNPMRSARRARSDCSTAPAARAGAPSICRARRKTISNSGHAGGNPCSTLTIPCSTE